MQESNDIRWKQRLENLKKICADLKEVLQLKNPNKFECAGIIQFFEMAVELSWKLMKDILDFRGFKDIDSPRAAIKTAFKCGLVDDASLWLKCIEGRNITSHTYNEQLATEIQTKIRNTYFPMIESFKKTMENLNE